MPHGHLVVGFIEITSMAVRSALRREIAIVVCRESSALVRNAFLLSWVVRFCGFW